MATLSELLDREEAAAASPATPAKALRADMDFIGNTMDAVRERASKKTAAWADVRLYDELVPEARSKLEAAFPDGPAEMLDLLSDGDGDKLNISVVGKSSRFFVELNNRKKAGHIAKMKRYFLLDRKVLTLIEIEIAEWNQGKGRRILRGTYEVATRLGIRMMRLEAKHIGCYVWARAGFLPETQADWISVAGLAKNRLDEKIRADLKNVSDAEREQLDGILRMADSRGIWQLADFKGDDGTRKIAKALLIGNAWEGELRFAHADSVKRLVNYCRADND